MATKIRLTAKTVAEAAAQRPSKDAAAVPGPSPFEARFAHASG
jgi:hypothetical protein